MPKLLFLWLLMFPIWGYGQYISLPEGDFMDTTRSKSVRWFMNYTPYYYYSFQAKYPESSATTTQKAIAFLEKRNVKIQGSGYVTFNFWVDFDGKMNYVQVLQNDEKYVPKQFDEAVITALYEFLKTFGRWKKVKYEEKTPLCYKAFISFRITDGQIFNIIP